MKVVHVCRIGGVGGAERHLLALLPALAELGLEVRFVGLDDLAAAPQPFYDALGVEAIRIPSPRDLDPALAIRLRRALRGADVVHTHMVHADAYGAVAAGGAALVSTKHNDDPFRTGPFRFAERALTARARRVIAISASLRRFNVERVGLPADKIDVVHYGLDAPPAPWGVNPPSDVPDEARVLLAVCRLVPQKGLDVAVAALARVRERHPHAVLVVLGEGPERVRLAGDGVHLLGRVGDVGAWLERAELLVHPVRWEGFGIAVLEAMLAAKPVVASAVSSIPELVVDGETGYLVPPDDPEALAAALVRALDEPGGLGEGGRRRAHAEFSVEKMAQRTLGVYTKAR